MDYLTWQMASEYRKIVNFIRARNEVIEVAAFDDSRDRLITEAEKKLEEEYKKLPEHLQEWFCWDMEWAGK